VIKARIKACHLVCRLVCYLVCRRPSMLPCMLPCMLVTVEVTVRTWPAGLILLSINANTTNSRANSPVEPSATGIEVFDRRKYVLALDFVLNALSLYTLKSHFGSNKE